MECEDENFIWFELRDKVGSTISYLNNVFELWLIAANDEVRCQLITLLIRCNEFYGKYDNFYNNIE